MAIVVRLLPKEGEFETTNKVAHITVGTRDNSVKPKEANDMLERWMEGGAEGNPGMQDVVLEERRVVNGEVRGVCNFHR